MRSALVTTALPYANGPLHLGHLVGYIQADIWVRARRLAGHTTHFVCADDTHGTPIMLAAEKAGVTPEAFIADIQASHERDFAAFGVAFDHYDSTNSPLNRELTGSFYTALEQNGHIARRNVAQFYDAAKGMFLPDRYIKGICPNCGTPDQYGDNCEVCGATYAPTDLKEPRSVLSGTTPEMRDSEHFFFEVGRFDAFLREWLSGDVALPGVKAKLMEWLDAEGGLRAWDISRDAPYFGFEIPGAPGKYFYVWLDAPIGYLSSFKALCQRDGLDFDAFLRTDSDAELHHFIGDEHDVAADQFFRFAVAGADAGEDLALAEFAGIQFEPQQLVGAFDEFADQHLADAQIELGEIADFDVAAVLRLRFLGGLLRR